MDFIYRKLIKNHNDISNSKVRQSYGKLASCIGIFSNFILFLLKILLGIISNSISVIADAINNLADASSSAISLVGFNLSSKPPDEKHPYGHARIEYLTSLIVSIIIIVVGINLCQESVKKIFNPESVYFTPTTLILLILSIFIKILQSLLNISIGKKINSHLLIATGADSRNDVISTTAVLFGSILNLYFDINIDGYLGLCVAIFIIYSGIMLTIEASSPLLGEAPSKELTDNLVATILSHKGILGVHDLLVHNYGVGKIFASAHIEVDASVDIMVSHELVDHLERDLSDMFNINFVAHLDPVEVGNPIISEVLPILEKAICQFEGLKNIHDIRCIKGNKRVNIIFDIVKEYGHTIDEKKVTIYLNKKLKEVNADYNAIITFDKAYTNL